MTLDAKPRIVENAELRTWFGVGGRADRFCTPDSAEQLAACVRADPALRVLGDGANLLVDDHGVDGLVVSLQTEAFRRVEISSNRVRVGAGASLPKLINTLSKRGLAGIEGLAGIPATIGGAIVMNAGGRFGEIADVVRTVHAIDRHGSMVSLERAEIDFGYRRSGLGGLIITAVELELTPDDPDQVVARQRECMRYKSESQPLSAESAGCCFKNPTLSETIEGIAEAGSRVSAGLLIDRAQCKGLRIGSAEVSVLHGNFITVDKGGSAGDVIRLMDEVARRVHDRFGVAIEREVVVWSRGDGA